MTKDIFDVIMSNNLEQLQYLLERGADPDASRTRWPNLRPLHAAVEKMEDGGSIEQIKILLEHGANINNTYEGIDSGTPLLLALFNKNAEAALLLLNAGADPNVTGEEGHSPLRWSVEESDHKLAQLLLSKGAHQTINEHRGISGMTVLGIAASKLDLKMVQLLLHAGADVGALDLDYNAAKQKMPDRTNNNAETWDKIFSLLDFKR